MCIFVDVLCSGKLYIVLTIAVYTIENFYKMLISYGDSIFLHVTARSGKRVLAIIILSVCLSWYQFKPRYMALNGLYCADVPLRNYSLTQAKVR